MEELISACWRMDDVKETCHEYTRMEMQTDNETGHGNYDVRDI